MPNDPLAAPIGVLARPAIALSPVDSLARAAHAFRDTPSWQLPVVEDGRLVGVVTDVSLARVLADGADWTDPVQLISAPPTETISTHATGAEALRTLSESGLSSLFVMSPDGYFVGTIGIGDLYSLPEEEPRPALVGGMATPMGVYLTTGSLRAGASGWALSATGFLLFMLFVAASYVGDGLTALFPRFGHTDSGAFWFTQVAPLLVFLASFRMMPLAGIHAAEHKVVHAIERGEPLEPAIVRRMPRVHPRCGTNLATGMSLFVGVLQIKWIPYDELRVFAAALVTLLFWRPLGNLVQFLITTRPPTEKHIGMGIASAKELLAKYALERGKPPTVARRLLASGFLHAAAGSTAGGLVYAGILWATGNG